jgi:chemotaxis response regulator CheB
MAFLAGFDRGGIGAIVLDVRMPGIGGLAVLERLVADGVDLPVIMLTGHGTVEMCRRAFKGGAAEFLEKPVDDDRLVEALQQAVRAARALARAARCGQCRDRALRATVAARARGAGAHRRRPDQQGDRPRAGTVAAHGGGAPRTSVRQARRGLAGAGDPPVRSWWSATRRRAAAPAPRSSTHRRP